MSSYCLSQDEKRCIGCHSCEVQCKTNKALPPGPKPCQVIAVGPHFVGKLPRAEYIFISCYHCENPWCVAACPTGAMRKREKDGIVYVYEQDCVGCKSCMSACPWGAPQWNPDTNKAVKCDYCMDRIDVGLKPACVTICTTQCLYFVSADQAPQNRRDQYARTMAAMKNE